jgi:membrane protease YdiL (CAAX protease family)
MAALEAGGVQAFLSFTAKAASAVVLTGLGPGARHGAEAVGVVRLALSLGVFSALYAGRFRRALEPVAGAAQTARCVAAAFAPRVTGPVALLLAFHAAQLAALTSPLVLGPGAPPLSARAATACVGTGAVVWGVLWEELVYRGLVFYVALQRSGGRVRFAALLTAAVFGAVHVGHALGGARGGGGGGAGVDPALLAVQVVGASLFGVTYAALFAATGSLGATALVHAANNVVALVWAAVDPARPPDGVLPCAPLYSHTLGVSVGVQAAVYALAAGWAWRDLAAELRGGGAAGPSNAFRRRHPLVYGGEGGAEEGHSKRD